ncbi:sensor domain-containing diguanylate cyclase [Salidesulfovibrio onnuriiensis]|uniref:sensor domain-containing diguanylate cyclase n=1 Tax=Salidesulfovibrio onnuriiensis TaxID=2583823 RepID=UPI0011CCBE5C|nr:sensor domain-containing diguanylate cyclase [Salidesulfovibrio onnuriiensis]
MRSSTWTKYDFGTPIKYRGAFRDITRRKRVEDELRSVNRLQQLILDNSIIGIALVRHRRFEWVNQQAADMTGMSVEDMTGSPTRVVYTDDEQYEYLGRTAYAALRSGNSYDAVFPFMHQTRGSMWCRFVATALNPEKPEDGSIWMFEDIHERRAADIALRKSRKELESIFENSQVGIMFLRDGRFLVRANQRLAEIFGYDSPEEMENLSMRALHLTERHYRDFGEQYYSKLVLGEQTQIEYRMRKKDGSAVWCSLSGKAVDTQKTIDLDKGVIWVIEDITVRKKAEAALRLSERRFRAIFTHAGVGICTIDREGVLHRVNHRICMLMGYEEYDLLGMNVKEIIHPDDFSQDAELRHRLWIRDIPMFVREERFVRRDGKVLWGRITTTVVRADDETPQYLLEVMEDITERKRLESELVRLARTDSLTGLKNRHYFMERGNEEFERFRRYGTHMCAMLMDIDHFKNINDTYGHHLGDLVLKKLAATCENILRKTDVFGRIGGEEFAMVLVELDLDTAHEIAERIRHEVENTVVETEEGDIRFTVSIGVTDLREDDANLEKTIQRADSLMYEAKQTGRNKVVKG